MQGCVWLWQRRAHLFYCALGSPHLLRPLPPICRRRSSPAWVLTQPPPALVAAALAAAAATAAWGPTAAATAPPRCTAGGWAPLAAHRGLCAAERWCRARTAQAWSCGPRPAPRRRRWARAHRAASAACLCDGCMAGPPRVHPKSPVACQCRQQVALRPCPAAFRLVQSWLPLSAALPLPHPAANLQGRYGAAAVSLSSGYRPPSLAEQLSRFQVGPACVPLGFRRLLGC